MIDTIYFLTAALILSTKIQNGTDSTTNSPNVNNPNWVLISAGALGFFHGFTTFVRLYAFRYHIFSYAIFIRNNINLLAKYVHNLFHPDVIY